MADLLVITRTKGCMELKSLVEADHLAEALEDEHTFDWEVSIEPHEPEGD